MAVQCLRNGQDPVYGLKADSVLNSLRYFQVCSPGLPPCLGHDLFEGTVSYDLKVYLRYFVKNKKCFSYTQLNRRIRQFKYQGSDASSAPTEASSTGNKTGGQATENWCLLRLLPVIIVEKIADTEDTVWRLVILLKKIV